MPRWWDRAKYPKNWEQISREFRASRNYTCEHCGIQQGTIRVSKIGRRYTARTVAAHKWPFDEANPYPELLCLCEICHMRYDRQFVARREEVEHQAVLHEICLEKEGFV